MIDRLIVRNWPHNDGGWEVLSSAVCKLETKESWWHNLVQNLRTMETDSINPRSRTGEDKMRCLGLFVRQGKRGKFQLALNLFSSAPQHLGLFSPMSRRAIYLTESTNANTNLIRRHMHRHTQNYCLICTLWLVKLTHKLAITEKNTFEATILFRLLDPTAFKVSPKQFHILSYK